MNIDRFLDLLCTEDIGRGDLFEGLVSQDFKVRAVIKAKEDGVLSGLLYARRLCERYGVEVCFCKEDSQSFKASEVLLELSGLYSVILKLERCLLNLLQHSSGIATLTYSYIEILKSAKLETALLDTRKTRPILRVFEKYSVRNGGGRNHRLGLDDALMLKDTHLKYIPSHSLKDFLKKARTRIPWTSKIEIESESVEFAKVAMECGADIVMCDNMDLDSIRLVVEHRNAYYQHILLEASGNITKDNLLEVAKSGVDAISSGALIHQARWVDMHMKLL